MMQGGNLLVSSPASKPVSNLKVKVVVAQSCLILCDPIDCSPPDSFIPGILQARILEWVTVPSQRIL